MAKLKRGLIKNSSSIKTIGTNIRKDGTGVYCTIMLYGQTADARKKRKNK